MTKINGIYLQKYALTALQQEILKKLGVEKKEIESTIIEATKKLSN